MTSLRFALNLSKHHQCNSEQLLQQTECWNSHWILQWICKWMRAPSALTGHQQNVRIWRVTFFKLFSRTIVGPWTSLVDASAQTWKDSLSIGSEQEFLFSQRGIIGDGSPAGIWIGQTTSELSINELRWTIRGHNFIIQTICQLPFYIWSWVTGVTLVLNWVKNQQFEQAKIFRQK